MLSRMYGVTPLHNKETHPITDASQTIVQVTVEDWVIKRNLFSFIVITMCLKPADLDDSDFTG